MSTSTSISRILPSRESTVGRVGAGLIGVLVFVLLWQILSGELGLIDDLLAPPPTDIWAALQSRWAIIEDNLFITLRAFIIAYTASTVLGIGVALLFSMSDRLRQTLMPIMIAGNSVPRVSLAPLLLFYFGVAFLAPLLAAWIAFFPMFMSAFEGFSKVDEDLQDLLSTLDATTYQEYRYVRLPNSVPYIFDGMRVSLTLAATGTIVAEFVATNGGVGYLAFFAMQNFMIALLFAIVLIISVVTFVLFISLYLVQSRVVYWEETDLFGGEA